MIINYKWKSIVAAAISLFFLIESPICTAKSHPGGGGGNHPHMGGGGGGGNHPHIGGGGHIHFGGGGGHFHFAGGGHPHISASSFHPAAIHHVFHTGSVFHTMIHHTNPVSAISAATIHHNAAHPAIQAANNAGRPTVAAHQHLTMNPHPGIPRSAYNGFNHYNGGNFSNWDYGSDFGSDYGYLWFFPFFMGVPDFYPNYYPYEDYYDSGYPNSYDYFYENEPYSETSQPAANVPEPTEQWVSASNGDVPANAVENTSENNNPTYYCRAQFNNMMYYGVLVPKDACYAQEQAVSLRFTSYEVMVQ